MPHDSSPPHPSNVIQLPLNRGKAGAASADEAASQEQAALSESRAIASCLDYLHGEARKLGKTMTAHLIGAAAESLRQESGQKEEITGRTS